MAFFSADILRQAPGIGYLQVRVFLDYVFAVSVLTKCVQIGCFPVRVFKQMGRGAT